MTGLRFRVAAAACAVSVLAACAPSQGKMGSLDAGYVDVFRAPADPVRAAARAFLEAEGLHPRDDDSLVSEMHPCPGNVYGFLWWKERYLGQWWPPVYPSPL